MSNSGIAQMNMSKDPSKMPSPPAETKAIINGKNVEIHYHQPAVKGRNVWAGSLAPYGKIWRTGANDAPTFEVSEDVLVAGKSLAKGIYALFTIPGETEWTIIFNKVAKQWGAYNYKENEDALRITVPSIAHEMTERFTIDASQESGVSLKWDKVEVKFNVE
ncbi:MAG: DUF2911 domain-containing protein [Pseudarcicella sp.]|nr:DUF2911 domain-containing protein [Pseudarcicella sp.]MBP6409667.1 DUF2911 domain-containing protein [Pseudarcicella sp.]